jgi:hypothetical protein
LGNSTLLGNAALLMAGMTLAVAALLATVFAVTVPVMYSARSPERWIWAWQLAKAQQRDESLTLYLATALMSSILVVDI